MKSALLSVWILFQCLYASEPVQPWLTRAEATGYRETSRYDDVMAFLARAQAAAPDIIRLGVLTQSPEGRTIPLVIVSQDGITRAEDQRRSGRPCVLIQANIHAGEVEGKEASLMLLRDLAQGKHRQWLEQMTLLFLPIFNADGNEKLGHNRRDNGPERAGVRHNGQNLDLNRDYLKAESPEVRASLRLFQTWDPLLFIDLHTTNGSLHRVPVTFSTHSHPATDTEMVRFMWKAFLPAVQEELQTRHQTGSIPYGNFINRARPEEGWFSDAAEGRYGTNYVGLRNRFSILSESYSHADFPTRVRTTHAFLQAILNQGIRHLSRMRLLAQQADRADLSGTAFPLTWSWKDLLSFDLDSYLFTSRPMTEEEQKRYPPWYGKTLVESTGKPKTYHLSYRAEPVPEQTRQVPCGYLLYPGHPEIEALLLRHGCTVLHLKEPLAAHCENLVLEHVKPTGNLFQGHVLMELSGTWEERTMTVPPGTLLLPVRGPLARLLPILMEPESEDSLARWGFFNRTLLAQWTNRPDTYPVLRVSSPQAWNALLSRAWSPKPLL